MDFPSHRVTHEPRSSVLSVLAAGLKVRRLFKPEQADMLKSLARFAAAEGLRMDLQVSLSALFDAGLDETTAVANALRQRKIDVMISDMDGTPLCGVELPQGIGPAHRDAVRRMAFAGARLPLLTLHEGTDWAMCRAQLIGALKLDELDEDLSCEAT